MRTTWALSLASAGALALTLAGCGDGHGGHPSADAGHDTGTGGDGGHAGGPGIGASAFPLGLAIASPTAPVTAASAHEAGAAREALVSVLAGKSYTVKEAELAALVAGTTAADCEVAFGPLGPGANMPPCYGPALDYQGHPDGTPANGQLPTGDLGMWEDTDASGQACAAATLNALVDTLGLRTDYGLYMGAATLCLMNVAGTALPAVGASVDMTTDLDAALATPNPGLAVDSATIARQDDDADGNAVYRFEFDLSVTMAPPGGGGGPGDTATIETSLEHVDLGSGAYHGKVWSQASLPGMGGPAVTTAYSVLYERDTAAVRFCARAADFPSASASLFDSNGNVDPTAGWTGGFTQGIFELDPDTGTGTVAYAWQAGSGDDSARVFNVVTSGSEPVAGCAFFGYGPRFDPSSSAMPDNSISKFICNWAGPGNSHTGLPSYAQKQCMTTNASGVFEPTASLLDYAPVNDCDTTDVTGFEYKVSTASTYETAPIASELVDLASDADFATFTLPTCPTDFMAE